MAPAATKPAKRPSKDASSKGKAPAAARPDPNRVALEGAQVVLHLVDEATGSYSLHLEVLHPDLGAIVQPREASFAGGVEGGLYVALTAPMAERAEEYLKRRRPR